MSGPFKMKGWSPFTQKEIDPDAPGTPGKPGYEPPVVEEDKTLFGLTVGPGQGSKREGKYTGKQYAPEFTTKVKTDAKGRKYTTDEDTGKRIYIQKGTPTSEGYVTGGESRTAK